MGAKLTEDEAEAIVHSVAHRVVKHYFRDLAIQKFAESIANASPRSNLSIAHDGKALAQLAETYFRDSADTYHWELKRPYRAHKITMGQELARIEVAGLGPTFPTGAR